MWFIERIFCRRKPNQRFNKPEEYVSLLCNFFYGCNSHCRKFWNRNQPSADFTDDYYEMDTTVHPFDQPNLMEPMAGGGGFEHDSISSNIDATSTGILTSGNGPAFPMTQPPGGRKTLLDQPPPQRPFDRGWNLPGYAPVESEDPPTLPDMDFRFFHAFSVIYAVFLKGGFYPRKPNQRFSKPDPLLGAPPMPVPPMPPPGMLGLLPPPMPPPWAAGPSSSRDQVSATASRDPRQMRASGSGSGDGTHMKPIYFVIYNMGLLVGASVSKSNSNNMKGYGGPGGGYGNTDPRIQQHQSRDPRSMRNSNQRNQQPEHGTSQFE